MKYKKLIISSLVLIIWLLVGYISPNLTSGTAKIINTSTPAGTYKINEVYDGDTISVNMDGRSEKVRLIGVDTPETHKPNSPVECGGPEASDFTKAKLSSANVRLEADPTNQNRDRYGRLLRYLYLADGTLFNKYLISEGYGTPYTSFPFQKKQEFIAAGVEAKQTGKGVWNGKCKVTDQNGRFKTNPI